MNDNNNNNAGGGIGFCGMLTIVLIALKLAGVIDWSWIWVLSPLWIPTVAIIVIAIVVVTIKELMKK